MDADILVSATDFSEYSEMLTLMLNVVRPESKNSDCASHEDEYDAIFFPTHSVLENRPGDCRPLYICDELKTMPKHLCLCDTMHCPESEILSEDNSPGLYVRGRRRTFRH